MSLRLNILTLYTPPAIKRKALERLFHATAEAFNTAVPETHGSSYRDRLRSYAVFTSAQAEKAISNPDDLQVTRQRLFDNAMLLGSELGSILHVRSGEDAMAAERLIYDWIHVGFTLDSDGNVVIKRCYFSSFYSASACRLIGCLDSGIFAGLSGGRRLDFYQTMTDGCDNCRAKVIERDQAL